jgi:hypothetical protein
MSASVSEFTNVKLSMVAGAGVGVTGAGVGITGTGVGITGAAVVTGFGVGFKTGAEVGFRVGFGVIAGVTMTVASSLPVTGDPSSSSPEAESTLTISSPPRPASSCVKKQLYSPPGRIGSVGASHEPTPSRLPNGDAKRLSIMTGSVGPEVFLMLTMYVTT